MEIEIYRGDTHVRELTFTTENNEPYDLTGCTVYFTVRPRAQLQGLTETINDNAATIHKAITSHSDPTGGKTTLELSKVDTNIDAGSYYYDIQIKTATDDIVTVTRDTFRIYNDVTRSEAAIS